MVEGERQGHLEELDLPSIAVAHLLAVLSESSLYSEGARHLRDQQIEREEGEVVVGEEEVEQPLEMAHLNPGLVRV